MDLEFPKKSAISEYSPEYRPAQSAGGEGVQPDVLLCLVHSQGKLQASMSRFFGCPDLFQLCH